jgi:predicted alpha/beta-fold hydrolase
MVLYYQPTSESFKHLIKITGLVTMEYRPWVGALNVHAQGFCFCAYEIWLKIFEKQAFEREILELSDGGEIALDWLVQPNTAKPFESKRNIIVLVPGVNGDSTKPYVFSVT